MPKCGKPASHSRRRQQFDALPPWTPAELGALERSGRENADRDDESDRQDAEAVAEAGKLLQ